MVLDQAVANLHDLDRVPVARAKQVADQWAFQGGIGVVERERGIQVLSAQCLVPRLEDVLRTPRTLGPQ